MAIIKEIEEKARRYDEALKRAKNHYSTTDSSADIKLIGLIFPELKESEDEKMIQYFKDLAPFDKADELYEKYGFSHKDAISWLEKHGGHTKFINGIQVGDKVTRNKDGVLVNLSQLNRVAKKQGEQKSAKFDDTNAKRMFIKALECVEEQNAKGYKLTDCDKNSWWEDFKAFCSEQNLANSAKTCKDEQDAAWSEEDALIIAKILCICNDFERSFESSPSSTKVIKEDVDKIDNWLKSLKDKYTWKPSEEQMKYLSAAIEESNENSVLESLYQDLKKLMEE